MCICHFLVCINIATRTNGSGAREMYVMWISQTLPVKYGIFLKLPWNHALIPWITLVPTYFYRFLVRCYLWQTDEYYSQYEAVLTAKEE